MSDRILMSVWSDSGPMITLDDIKNRKFDMRPGRKRRFKFEKRKWMFEDPHYTQGPYKPYGFNSYRPATKANADSV